MGSSGQALPQHPDLPRLAQVLAAAGQAQAALAAAQQLQADLPHLVSGTHDPGQWLSGLRAALMALDLATDTRVLTAMLQARLLHP